MTSVSNDNSQCYNAALTCAGIVAGWEAQTYLKKYMSKPTTIFFHNNLKDLQGGEYKPYLEKALKQNHLDSKLKIIDLNKNNEKEIAKSLGLTAPSTSLKSKLISHILRIKEPYSSFTRTIEGRNAFFAQDKNVVVCNFDKFSTPVFHEIQHKLNSTSKNIIIRGLANIRNPLAFLAPLGISLTTLLTDKKEEGEKEGINDQIKKNCGWLTALSFLPLAIDECIANIKGTKIAQNAGVNGSMLNKVKKLHRISIINYCTLPIIAGLSAWGGNKIRDYICSQKKENV